MLAQILDSHPGIKMTYELHNFQGVGKPLSQHLWLLRRRNRWKLPPVRVPGAEGRWPSRVAGIFFLARYSIGLVAQRKQTIDLECMRRVLGGIFPQADIVGDKYPRYVFQLDQFTAMPGLLVVVIHRDARDVVRSAIEKAMTSWRNTEFGARLSTPASAASSWVQAIESMEQSRERVHVIGYEQLVGQSETVLHALGQYLAVDPAGFNPSLIKPDSVGKHRQGLSDADRAVVEEVAGDPMRRLGYL